MLLAVLGVLAAALTCAMFASRQSMLGFPAAMFWAMFGAYCYQQSTATWDMYFLIAFASLLGMVFFCMYSAYGLRENNDQKGTDEDEYIDEKAKSGDEEGAYFGESKNDTAEDKDDQPHISQRTAELRERARKRKSGILRGKTRWGEFK
jgi:hypothetical protein